MYGKGLIVGFNSQVSRPANRMFQCFEDVSDWDIRIHQNGVYFLCHSSVLKANSIYLANFIIRNDSYTDTICNCIIPILTTNRIKRSCI